MILVLLVVFIAMVILGSILYNIFDCDGWGPILMVIGIIGGAVSFIATIILTGCVISDTKLDDKIAMYTEENAVIEQQIAECVERYQEYEQGVFAEVSPSDAVAVVTLYPDLKSDGLVQAQIETYVENNDQIKSLKEKKIDSSVRKWWLYFGG